LNTSQCSQELEDLNLESRKHIQTGNVLDTQRLINTQSKPTKNTSQNTRTTEMQQRLIPKNCQDLTYSLEDFLAKLSVLLEEEKDLRILGERFFMTLRESLKAKDLGIYCLKTLKGYSITTKGKLLPSSLKRFGNLGITLNMGWLIVGSSEFHRIGKESLLLEVIEKNVEPKYFLSEATMQNLIKRVRRGWNSSMMETIKAKESTRWMELVQQYPQASQEEIMFRLLQTIGLEMAIQNKGGQEC